MQRIITTVLMATVAAGCAAEQRRVSALDNGRTMIGDQEMIIETPVRVDCSCSDVPCADLVQAASWWNSQVYQRTHRGPVVLVQMGRQPGRPRGCFVEADLPPGIVSEEVGTPFSGRLFGTWYARIQRGRARQGVIRHAMGHAMGLADDPPTTTTLDLRSIMQADAPEYGTVTAADAVRVARYFQEPGQ